MSDVIHKIIVNNTIKNGGAVVAVDNLGNYQTKEPEITTTPVLANMQNKYTNKFTTDDYVK